jgi:hypothetical protein
MAHYTEHPILQEVHRLLADGQIDQANAAKIIEGFNASNAGTMFSQNYDEYQAFVAAKRGQSPQTLGATPAPGTPVPPEPAALPAATGPLPSTPPQPTQPTQQPASTFTDGLLDELQGRVRNTWTSSEAL